MKLLIRLLLGVMHLKPVGLEVLIIHYIRLSKVTISPILLQVIHSQMAGNLQTTFYGTDWIPILLWMFYLKVTHTLLYIFHYLHLSLATDIRIAITIFKESQTQPKMLHVWTDNVIKDKTIHVQKRLFASKIALQFQVALY
jgi:hypothetical protein